MKIKIYTLLTIIGTLQFTPVFAFTNLTIPFTPQAPQENWSQPWQDACEEAVIAMVDYFYAGHSEKTIERNKTTKMIKEIYDLKTKTFGWSLDEDTNKIVTLINNYYGWEARIFENPTIEQIKNEINNNRPIIVPTFGKALQNKYFKDGGPDYHTLIISGYDDEKKEFITQEPGTKFGLDFRYSYDKVMNAIHDFLPNQKTKFGKKNVIFTTKDINLSGQIDADKDGLSKIEEIKHGTVLWLADSDGDGYSDGQEVYSGYLPTLAEKKLADGTLIKTPLQPKVYIIEKEAKKHIKSEEEFMANGFSWSDIITVSPKFINSLKTNL